MMINKARRGNAWGTLPAVTALLLTGGAAAAGDDFGILTEDLLHAQSNRWFGVLRPLQEPASPADYVPRAIATAGQRVKLAKGLHAEFVTRSLAADGDMIALWPNRQNPTHLIVCIENGRNAGGTNPSVQRVHLASGNVQTILHGMSACDGIRTTPWGTILATEEEDDGRAYEIIAPLTTSGHWIEDRATGLIRTEIGGSTTSSEVVQRPALPTMAWEGIAVLPTGAVIAGDELRPGSDNLDDDGGAIFKFVPDNPHDGGPISDLSQSPLVSGRVYAMTLSCRSQSSSSFPQYGQGCEVGVGAWVRVNALTARADANALGATGYYRPEDLHYDPDYPGPGIRFCWTNTGNEDANNYGEVFCAVDPNPLPAAPMEWVDSRTGNAYLAEGGTQRSNVTTVVANRFLEGDARFNSFDNLEFQPGTRNVYVIEDHDYGEVIACLPDGADRDIKTDGCVSILSVVDPDAEPTGFIFDATGETAYVIVQHGEQPPSLQDPRWGGTDDLLKITGFKTKK